MIETTCPSCGHVLRSGDAARGKTIPCPKCRTPFVVGFATAAPPPPVRTIGLVEVRAQHPQGTIVVASPERLVALGEWVAGSLAKVPQLQEGLPFWIGTAPAVLCQRGGEWWACEPDLENPGTVRTWDVFDALVLRALSEQVCAATGVTFTRVPMMGMVLVFRDSMRDELVFLRRDQPSAPEDTGWYLQVLEDLDDRTTSDRRNLAPMSVYQVYVRRPALLAVMMLPVGWVGLFERHKLVQVLDPDNRVVWKAPPGPDAPTPR